jgi:hypothetical protein
LSLFEEHTQIITRHKAGKMREFGREVLLDEVDGGIISRYEILSESGSERSELPESLKAHQQRFGRAPHLLAADRGLYSVENERLAQEARVKRVALPKSGKLSEERKHHEKQRWFRRGFRFRAGIEGRIDGWGGYDEAMLEVWGEVPEYKGRGRPPTKKRPKAQWQYLQMVKQREKGRLIGMKAKTIYADQREVLLLLGASTSYVERTNLTSRHMNGRSVRKTLGYSKKLKMLSASSIWEEVLYKLGRALKTLRVESLESDGQRRWMGRWPAMAAGLTEHIWKIEELLTTLPLPSTNT